MPTYEYECEKCGLRFEEFQSITAEPLTKCKNEACDGTVKRLFSAGGGFIFKGSGFYITDYRSDSYKKGAQSDSSSKTAVSPSKMTDSPKKSDTSSSGGTSSSASPSKKDTSGSSSSK